MTRKILIGLALVTILYASPFFDNSIDRWESDCSYNVASGCAIAAKMYKRGNWEDARTGKIIKIKISKKEREEKYLKLLKKACILGDKKSCELLY